MVYSRGRCTGHLRANIVHCSCPWRSIPDHVQPQLKENFRLVYYPAEITGTWSVHFPVLSGRHADGEIGCYDRRRLLPHNGHCTPLTSLPPSNVSYPRLKILNNQKTIMPWNVLWSSPDPNPSDNDQSSTLIGERIDATEALLIPVLCYIYHLLSPS